MRLAFLALWALAAAAAGFVLVGFVLMMPSHEQTAADLERARFAVGQELRAV